MQRRAGREELPTIDDDMIIEVTIDDTAIDDHDDLTQIRELVRELRPADLANAVDVAR